MEITDPKKAVGLWSNKVVRETAMTPVGNTKLALGRFLPQDVARWKRREEMAAAMEAKRSAECGESKIPVLRNKSVPVYAYSFSSVGNVRSRSDSFVVEEVMDVNKVMHLARDGRLFLYSIDFGGDKWLADIVFSKENKQPCKIVPSIPILSPEGVEKKDALQESRKSGTDVVTKLAVASEAAQAFITFTFNPTVARDNRKVEGRSWKSYLDAFPAEAHREVVRWNGGNVEEALQKVIKTDGVLLTDKEHLDEALRAATYVIPRATNNQQLTTTKATF